MHFDMVNGRVFWLFSSKIYEHWNKQDMDEKDKIITSDLIWFSEASFTEIKENSIIPSIVLDIGNMLFISIVNTEK